jgi:hypothetical protein
MSWDPASINTVIALGAAVVLASTTIVAVSSNGLVRVIGLSVNVIVLMTVVWFEHERHADPCADIPALHISEYCAERSMCGGLDFVAIRNPSSVKVGLECFVIADTRKAKDAERQPIYRVLPQVELLPNTSRRLYSDELGFGLSKRNDRIELKKIVLAPGKPLQFTAVGEQHTINDRCVYAYIPGLREPPQCIAQADSAKVDEAVRSNKPPGR